MIINWGTALNPKYLSCAFGSEWDKDDFKFIGFRKTPLGRCVNAKLSFRIEKLKFERDDELWKISEIC